MSAIRKHPFYAIALASMGLSLSVSAQAEPLTVTLPSSHTVDETYTIVVSNVMRCFGGDALVFTTFPGSNIQTPLIAINGTLGHQFIKIDIVPQDKDVRVQATLTYALGRKSRAEDWQAALQAWLAGQYQRCPKIA